MRIILLGEALPWQGTCSGGLSAGSFSAILHAWITPSCRWPPSPSSRFSSSSGASCRHEDSAAIRHSRNAPACSPRRSFASTACSSPSCRPGCCSSSRCGSWTWSPYRTACGRSTGRGSGMHLDFVLADAVTLGPALVIELDDKTHWRADARERDAFKDTALASAGVPVLRVRAARGYDVRELRDRRSNWRHCWRVRRARSAGSGRMWKP